jgi:sulfatase modifying factor 1
MRLNPIRSIRWIVFCGTVLLFCECSKTPLAPEYPVLDMDWIFVKGGAFRMGEKPGGEYSREWPVHFVVLSDFVIGKYEVNNTQFAAFLDACQSDTVKSGENRGSVLVYPHDWGLKKTNGRWAPAPGYENHPVLNTTWEGADAFCKFFGWRLPTEAEWEFAAKGGNKGKGYAYSGSPIIDDVGWYWDNSDGHTHPVGDLKENELGIYDMNGNVWEWCRDWYAPYDSTFQINPTGPSSGKNHVYRGGCWLSHFLHSDNTFRCGGGIDYHGIVHNGFRCVKGKNVYWVRAQK